MYEIMKNKVILILAILTCIFFIITIDSCNNSRKQKNARNKEMITRLDLEEKMNNLLQEKNSLEQKIKILTKQLEDEVSGHQITKKALQQEQLISESLKEELQKLTKLKEALEQDLKEALVSEKSKDKK